MSIKKTMTARDIALTICFAALYAVFGFIAISPIIGLPGRAVTAAAITAPVVGIILGPYLGMLSTIFGGAIGFFAGIFSPPSFFSGIVASTMAGMLYQGRRSLGVFVYFSLLFLFAFYPFVGPVWLFPLSLWFQVAGLLILISPLQSMAVRDMRKPTSNAKLTLAFFVTCLTSTLAGQIAGSLVFEVLAWPVFVADVSVWRLNWIILSWLYPVERVTISLAATFVGVALFRVLKRTNLAYWSGPQGNEESEEFTTSSKSAHEYALFERHHHVCRPISAIVKIHGSISD